MKTTQQPHLSFWQIWNVSFGFLGVQIGFALQNANISRVLSDLGADLSSLSLFWLAAPIMGLIVQPIVGAASDKTWTRLGRRIPYILAGALVAFFCMMLLPNASLLVAIIPPMLFGVIIFAIKDAAFNVTFQPFRSLVADMVPAKQRNVGYSVQALLINIGAVLGSILPFLLTNVIGLDNASTFGETSPSVAWAFYIGATVLLAAVLWTVISTKEYSPAEYRNYKGLKHQQQIATRSLAEKLIGFRDLLLNMPNTMKQLALVQFFSWFALFMMWVYTPTAITQHIWGVDAKWFDPDYLGSVAEVPSHIAQAKGAAGDWVGILFAAYSLFAALFSVFMSRIADRFGRKTTYAAALAAGGIGFISFYWLDHPQLVTLTDSLQIPLGAMLLTVSMIGIGVAWAAILAMPYAILAGTLPADKTGVYMGVFNFTITFPQIISSLAGSVLIGAVFNGQGIFMIITAGIAMFLAAISVVLVKDNQQPV